jgi:hypothetical protein
MRGKPTFVEGWRAFWMSFRFMRQHGMKSWILFFAIAAVVAWGGMACAWWYSLGLLREAILESSFLEIWQSSAVTANGSFWSRSTRLLKHSFRCFGVASEHEIHQVFCFGCFGAIDCNVVRARGGGKK